MPADVWFVTIVGVLYALVMLGALYAIIHRDPIEDTRPVRPAQLATHLLARRGIHSVPFHKPAYIREIERQVGHALTAAEYAHATQQYGG